MVKSIVLARLHGKTCLYRPNISLSKNPLLQTAKYKQPSFSSPKIFRDTVIVEPTITMRLNVYYLHLADNDWIEVDLQSNVSVAGIILQGRSDIDEWVKTYKVQCDSVTVQEYSVDKVKGNKLFSSAIVIMFNLVLWY